MKLHVEPGGSYTVEFQSYPHSLQYYTLITIIIIAVYLSTLHLHTIIGSVTAQPVIQGKPATITVEVWKLGLIPKTHNIKIIIDNKEINIGTIRLTKPRKYKIKIIIKDGNTNLEII